MKQNVRLPFSSVLRWSLFLVGSVFFLISLCTLRILEDSHVEFSISRPQEVLSDDWPHPFIHIVNTRFMQNQGELVDLARARLILFDTFCLGSIRGQSLLSKSYETPPFLWIIKTDPDLDAAILKEFLSLIEPYPFIYLVASNVNYGIGIHPGGWRGGEAGADVLQSRVYSGNMTLFRHAHASRESRAILETRLDADDGLHVDYLETIQDEARARLKCSPKVTQHHRQKWMYWCPLNHLDWSPTPPFAPESIAQEYGVFLPMRSSHNCITAGITLGVSVGQQEESIPRFMHHELYEALRVNKTRATCDGDRCLRMINKPIISAIRSRTATSAGMRGVVAGKDEEALEKMNRFAIPVTSANLVSVLEFGFHVELQKTIVANHYMQKEVAAIAADNLRGQCQPGHSCKNSTREALGELLRAAGHNIHGTRGSHPS